MMMKKLFLAISSLMLMLCLPAWIDRQPYLVLNQNNFKHSSTYTEPYHELMKKVSTLFSPQKEVAVTVSAWQDSDGNMHFSDQGQAEVQNTQRYEVKNHYTGRLAFPAQWVWATMASVWLVFYIAGLLTVNWLANRAGGLNQRRPANAAADDTQTQNGKSHQYIDYEKVNAPKTSPYKILGVGDKATLEEIKTAYRNKIKQYHPDKVAHLGNELQDVARKKTTELNRAYEILTKQK